MTSNGSCLHSPISINMRNQYAFITLFNLDIFDLTYNTVYQGQSFFYWPEEQFGTGLEKKKFFLHIKGDAGTIFPAQFIGWDCSWSGNVLWPKFWDNYNSFSKLSSHNPTFDKSQRHSSQSRLVAGGWRLVAGDWRLVVGGWRLVVSKNFNINFFLS